ncbi:TPA: GIY-YIG nuclease family protein [Legionella pneumophila]|nr:GIY-YIG nuclease family protein [Legionella pneumophila]HBC0466094.1 GIY-YIG nuclease family protein [Legionella pneumophila]HBD9375889.1 GIY-YIG nuclease family protein [Legionella pneumophila]HDV6633418.1 GIY-YIG nuclease family protein [Legionella pneumophila]
MFWVYILQCSDKSYYTGQTDNLEKRLMQHQDKMIPGCYTSTRLPIQLKFCQEFMSRQEALIAERQIKGWSRRKKEALINGDWQALSDYSKRKS